MKANNIKSINKGILKAIACISIMATPLSQAAPIQNETQTTKPRIIGGTNAVEGNWPFMVAVMPSTADTNTPFCGASYIGGDLILTAAHCVERTNAEDIKVALGLHKLSTNSANTQHIAVKNIYVHEGYNQPNSNSNDIAVLQLERTPTNIQAVEIATLTETNQLNNGDLMTVMGWGNTIAGVSSQPDILKQVNVPFVPLATCQNAGNNYNNVGIDALCAGFVYSGYDSCQGDSGGPLVKTIAGKTKQIGVVSWGDGCAVGGKYGVYAKAAYFEDWINKRRNGISYTQNYDIGYQLQGSYTHTFTVENSTAIPLQINSVTLTTHNISDAVISNDSCSVNTNQTGNIAPNTQCQVTVKYTSNVAGEAKLSLAFTTDYAKEPQFTTTLSTVTLVEAFKGEALSDVTNLTGWMSNESPWIKTQDTSVNNNPTVLRSNPNLFHSEISLTAVNIEGKGTLSFDYRTSSELNFDFFTLTVNGVTKLADSGQQNQYSSVSIPLTEDKSTIYFAYLKDNVVNNGEDTVFLKNILFTPTPSYSDDTDPVAPIASVGFAGSSSGGNTGLLSLLMLLGFALRRRSTHKVSA